MISKIHEIIITGDLNFNILSSPTRRKIKALCTQFMLFQSITQPTHFTETSSSLIDVILVSNKEHLVVSGVGDPFLHQELRYHRPVFGILKFSKPKIKAFKRHIWSYDKGNYELLRNKARNTDWYSLRDENIDTYATNIRNSILAIASECIPNKCTTVKPSDPPWITSVLKRQIRKRRRAYRKAKATNQSHRWTKFKRLRNKVTTLIRHCKQQHTDKITQNLKSENLSSKNWWSTLKAFIFPQTHSDIPPLGSNDNVYTNEMDKANLLNDHFQCQTILNEQNAILPPLPPPPPACHTQLSSIILTPLEVESTLQTLKVGEASGLNGLNNRILHELSSQLASPFCSLNQSLRLGIMPASNKEANVCPVLKKGDLSVTSSYRTIYLLNSESKVFEKTIFKHLYNHLQENNMLSSFQSGFIPGDSTINQLTYLYHIFCEALDSGKEVRPSSVTSAKPLIMFGTQDSYTNLKQLVSQERFLTGSKVISLTDENVLFFQVYLLSGTLLEQVCLRDEIYSRASSLSSFHK